MVLRGEILIKGLIQGVGFRPFIYRLAIEKGLKGYVRNRGDAGVEVIVEGNIGDIKNFLEDLVKKKPHLSSIYKISVRYSKVSKEFKRFFIEKSIKKGDSTDSSIPFDVAICNDCVREVLDPGNRRFNYFFTTCTQCGPRYTIIDSLPYDRENTTMRDFTMCKLCKEEYMNPLDRRFHAQTIACKDCGPKSILIDNKGEVIEREQPIQNAGKLLAEGHIVAIKGNGGFHIATSTIKDIPIKRLRDAKNRSQKPFAIMAKDLRSIKTFSEVNRSEEKILLSEIKPIVLLKKSSNYYLSEFISPGLHNIGIMLPYTALHYILFQNVSEPAFVMTSANYQDEPIILDNKEALNKLGNWVDFFLLHNRKISQRCDDSVVRLHRSKEAIIRRSRGYVPAPFFFKRKLKVCSLGIGGDKNVNSCIIRENKAVMTQHIGEVENLEGVNFLESAIRHIMNLIKSKLEIIACDLHPNFSTTKLAQNFSEELGCKLISIQHHLAHVFSLMGEHNLQEIIGIICDGFGYGLDGKAWGGEIFYCGTDEYKRLGHLQVQPMVGGDLATIYPLRMVAGILKKRIEYDWFISRKECFPYGEDEINTIMKQLEASNFIETTSCGRILDAVSALLGICYKRTYEGEPAIKLESASIGGKDVLKLETIIKNNVIDTTSLLDSIYDNKKLYKTSDLAFSAETYLAKSLAKLAIEKAKEMDVKLIGFSGGVSYNDHIFQTIKRMVSENGYKFLANERIPSGDGGISFGQAFAANFFNQT